MKTIQTDAGKIKIEDILNGIAQLKVTDLEGFAKKVMTILEKKKTPDFKQKENELIHKIKNGGPSKEFQKRYNSLLAKSVKGIMTDEENEEFLTLIPTSEKWSVDRLQLIIELAKLKNTSIQEVMNQLEITTPSVIHA